MSFSGLVRVRRFGKTKGACPGYVVDHGQGLNAAGADQPSHCNGRRWRGRRSDGNGLPKFIFHENSLLDRSARRRKRGWGESRNLIVSSAMRALGLGSRYCLSDTVDLFGSQSRRAFVADVTCLPVFDFEDDAATANPHRTTRARSSEAWR